MKRFSLILAAMMLLVGFTQCKKDNETPTSDEGVRITLTTGYGPRNEKTEFDPITAGFVWEDGATEYIYVGGSSHGTCLGVLSGTGNGEATMSFSGDLTTTPNDGETLHFFYLGKGRDGSAVTDLDFSNQDGTLENVTKYHIAIGDATYSTGQTSFSATLDMKMAIAYFNTSGFGSGSTVYLHGEDVYSYVRISYTNGSISYTSSKKDHVKIGTSNEGVYVALIPSQNENETTLKFESDSKSGELVFLRGIKPGRFYSNNKEALNVTAQSVTDDAIPGLFSVSSTKVVRFSKGNLQYQASTGTWRFAEHQYDYVGDAEKGNVREKIGDVENAKCNNANIANNYEGWIDLFGFGTSGYDNRYPYENSTTASDYYNQNISNTNYDWGVFNSVSIINGGEYSTWRTLTKDEWVWLLGPNSGAAPGTNCRVVSNDLSTNARFTMATVNGVKGLIIFPDIYKHPAGVTITKATFNSYSNYTATISPGDWTSMEDAGAVFLPASGYRNGTALSYVQERVYYCSTNLSGESEYHISFISYSFNPASTYPGYRYYGRSVRLVRE